jgi:hypothetical protein
MLGDGYPGGDDRRYRSSHNQRKDAPAGETDGEDGDDFDGGGSAARLEYSQTALEAQRH